MNLVEKITKDQIRTDLPEFRVGDTVVVGWKVIEGKRERGRAAPEGVALVVCGGRESVRKMLELVRTLLLENYLVVLV